MMTRINCTLLLVGAVLHFSSCYHVDNEIAPSISYQLQERKFSSLSSSFLPLSQEEKNTDWGRELLIAHYFAEDLDLYRAIFTYKRALVLIPEEHASRKLEAEYNTLLCYYLGNRYKEAVDCFEKTSLARVDKTFESHHDLLLVLHECFHEMNCPEKKERIHEMIAQSYPETIERLRVSHALRGADLSSLRSLNNELPSPSFLDPLLLRYDMEHKSVAKAKAFNAICPGAGYLYIGQKKSAVTAFLLNGLFITAAYQFFSRGHLAAGIITTSFEAGWYFGGIYGAGEEAKFYNERIYETGATSVLHEKNLFPPLMLRHAF